MSIPHPPAFESAIDPVIILGVFSFVALGAALYAVWWSIRDRDPIPVFACAGAFVCALNEPFYDILGQIVYAEDHLTAYNGFGRDIPWFLVVGYIPWVGLLPCFVAKMMSTGVSRRSLHLLALGSCISVIVVETLGNLLDGWDYYGEAPLKFLVVAPQLAPVPIVGGLLIYSLAYLFTGWRRAGVAFAVSTVALPMVFAGASWPLYVGLNFDLPMWLDWILAVAMLGLTAAFVVGATSIAERLRLGALAGQGRPADSRAKTAV
ncbi:hypothetical protein CYJ73_24300 [Gordonia terrae]|uniref:Carotenoid biosynthesis protein n=1 Tax=Gordonia terrae TaxID=2055 RepID=A0A2I1R1D0_9ACTN|nr:hypothetical protein [Gordonia terrae]PKZ62943.1 hypothetical protein CYJ73_24300 [Gordonia terrae]